MSFKIKELRKHQNMTQRKLCEEAGISRPTLINLERGKEVNVTIATLNRIASALKCKISDIFLS